MQLVGQYDSPYVRRVAISLHLLELPFTRNAISVFADEAEMRRINPLVRIPSLVLDDGEVLVDSHAILDHIDETVGPERSLLPARGPERRRALKIVAYATGAIDKAGAVAYERLLRPVDKVHQPWVDRCLGQLAAALAALEALPRSPWLTGSRIMQPDVTVGDAGLPAPARARRAARGALSEPGAAVRRLRGPAGVQGHRAGARRDHAGGNLRDRPSRFIGRRGAFTLARP